MFMTRQQIFDKCANHLINQNAQSLNTSGDCAYRSDNDTKCAIGGLIPNSAYVPSIEGIGVGVIQTTNIEGSSKANKMAAVLRNSNINPNDKETISLLLSLQIVHDEFEGFDGGDDFNTYIKNELKIIAKDYLLECNF